MRVSRVLILGADGMVGHMARLYLGAAGHEVVSVARTASLEWDSLDVEREGALVSYIAEAEPAIVLNCVGVLIQECEQQPLRAIRLNAMLPRVLEASGRELGFRLIQVSTDCVFSGAQGPYKEQDRRDADEVYGRTKALGEVENDRDLTIRTSKVGPELKESGTGLFNWFMMQKGKVHGFRRGMWGGVTTLEMAKAVDHVIRNPIAGLVHLTNGEPISKYALLCLFAEIWDKRDVVIERDDARVTNRSLLCTRKDFTYKVPSYRDMLLELHSFMSAHRGKYSHYASVLR
jgi:dTDP-4-dehydrorhamnose reductase